MVDRASHRVPPLSRHAGRASARSGFTLVEMIVVMGIIVLLMSLLVPALKGFQAEARSATCLNHLRQLFVGIDSYRSAQKDMLPMCEFIPVATDQGPQGGLPLLLKGYVEPDCECWRCASDFDESDSLSTGTSYLYVPGLIRYTPQIQIAVLQSMVPYLLDPTKTQAQKDKIRLEAEAKLVTRFYEANPEKFAILSDSQDRHTYGDRVPRNALYLDGSARMMQIETETAVD